MSIELPCIRLIRFRGSLDSKISLWQRFSSEILHNLPHIAALFPSRQDTVTGFLLAGVGHRTASGSNFLIVKQDTKLQLVEEAFQDFSTRDDVGIILINQHVANDIRHVLKDYNETIPTVLEIPSKEHPYDPEQDYIMVNMQLWVLTLKCASFRFCISHFILFVCYCSNVSTCFSEVACR